MSAFKPTVPTFYFHLKTLVKHIGQQLTTFKKNSFAKQ